MDLKKLEYLESIYRLRNFTKAAEEQYISQPSISSAIQSLEDELGVMLINRNTRPLSFTAAGEEFMQYVHRILQEVQDATDAMKRLSKKAQESLRIAIYTSSTSLIIPRVYMDFHNLYPQYNLSILEETLTVMLEQILSGELDMAYALIPEDYNQNEYEVFPIMSCELWVLLSKQHPLAGESSISLKQLESERIYSYPIGALIRKKLDQELVRQKITLEQTVLHRANFMLPLVSQNQGVALILHDPFYYLQETSDLTARPLKTSIVFQAGLIYKKGKKFTSAMKDMKNYLKNLHA